jgi:BCD family chlorophyll transporter-like MFS transporter
MIFSIEAAAFVLAAILAVKATGGAAMNAGAAHEKREVYA